MKARILVRSMPTTTNQIRAGHNIGKVFAYPFSTANGLDLIVTLPDLGPLHCALTVMDWNIMAKRRFSN
jgi:hypothetical protein